MATTATKKSYLFLLYFVLGKSIYIYMEKFRINVSSVDNLIFHLIPFTIHQIIYLLGPQIACWFVTFQIRIGQC